jgi:hypothetical protein
MLFLISNGGTIAALTAAAAAYWANFPVVSQDHISFAAWECSLPASTVILIAPLRTMACGGSALKNISTWTKFIALAVL